MTINPYQPPTTDVSAGGQMGAWEAEPLTNEELAAFVGPNDGYYVGRWQRTLPDGRFYAGFNWAAAILSMFWLLHRKMYREFALVLIAILVLSTAVGVVLPQAASNGDDRTLDLLLRAITGVTVGTLGNALYLRRARIAIARARREAGSLEGALALLRLRGGTTWLWPVIAAIVNSVAMVGLR
jgi:hypothetical protein